MIDYHIVVVTGSSVECKVAESLTRCFYSHCQIDDYVSSIRKVRCKNAFASHSFAVDVGNALRQSHFLTFYHFAVRRRTVVDYTALLLVTVPARRVGVTVGTLVVIRVKEGESHLHSRCTTTVGGCSTTTHISIDTV